MTDNDKDQLFKTLNDLIFHITSNIINYSDYCDIKSQYIYWRTVCFDNDLNIICHHLYFLSKVFFHISTTFITGDIKSKNTFRILNNTLEEEQSFSLFLILSSLLEDLKISFFLNLY